MVFTGIVLALLLVLASEVQGENTPPTATIESIYPPLSDEGENITFIGTGNDTDGTITGYLWYSDIEGDLSLNASFSSTQLSPSVHTIFFKVKDDNGTWSAEVSIEIWVNALPQASIEWIWTPYIIIPRLDFPDMGIPYNTACFSGSGNDTDGYIEHYQWSYDGLTTVSYEMSFYDYFEFGNHTIFLRVQDNEGALSPWVTKDFYVNRPPSATIDTITPSPANLSQQVTFVGSGNDSDGISAYKWFSDLDGTLSFNSSFVFSFTTPGAHLISFSVRDGNGLWSYPRRHCLRVGVKPIATIDSISPSTANLWEEVHLEGSGYVPSCNFGDYSIYSDFWMRKYEWRSDIDGWLSDKKVFSISNLSPGVHSISLRVRDNEGIWSESVNETLTIHKWMVDLEVASYSGITIDDKWEGNRTITVKVGFCGDASGVPNITIWVRVYDYRFWSGDWSVITSFVDLGNQTTDSKIMKGDINSLSFYWPEAQVGDYIIVAYLDPNDKIEEVKEDNNIFPSYHIQIRKREEPPPVKDNPAGEGPGPSPGSLAAATLLFGVGAALLAACWRRWRPAAPADSGEPESSEPEAGKSEAGVDEGETSVESDTARPEREAD